MPKPRWRNRVAGLVHAYGCRKYVEIGVNKGELSMMVATKPCVREMILIDPWMAELRDPNLCMGARAEGSTAKYGPISQKSMDRVYARVVSKTSKLPIRVMVLRMTSENGRKYVRDESQDFIFIDALHDYESVKQDIELWLPKVRAGGIIAGDDYHEDFPGVVQAVDEFGGCDFIGDTARYPQRIWWKKV